MLRKINQSMKAWWRRNVVADDPTPEYSRLDRMDGRGTVDLTPEPTPLYDDVVAESQARDGLAAEVEAWLAGGAR